MQSKRLTYRLAILGAGVFFGFMPHQSSAGTYFLTKSRSGEWCSYSSELDMRRDVSEVHFMFYATLQTSEQVIERLRVTTYGREYDLFINDIYEIKDEKNFFVKRTVENTSDGYKKAFHFQYQNNAWTKTPTGDGLYDDEIIHLPYVVSSFNIWELLNKKIGHLHKICIKGNQ